MGRSCDLLVIGGGPAGSTLACLVKKHNPSARVVLVEKAAFPRHHIGESLLPAVKPVLAEMGVLDKIEAAPFLKKMGAAYIWGKDRAPWNADFEAFDIDELIALRGDIPPEAAYAWQVRRAEYDHILLEHAKSCGVEVVSGAAEGILEDEDRVIGAKVRTRRGVVNVRSAWLADCSGQSGFMSRFRPIREFDDRLKNVAAYSYFEGAPWRTRFTGHPDKTRIFVCSVPCGWFWYIPVASDVVSVGLVTTHAYLVNNGIKDVRALYDKEVKRCPEIGALLKSARRVKDVDKTGKDFFTISDWSYLCKQAAGKGWLAVGDAAVFVDPIFSSGVTLAHLGAQRAAHSLTTIWKGGAAAAARQDEIWDSYSAFCRETASGFLVMALYWYGKDGSQKKLWKRAKEIFQARLPESIDDLKAYVAVVSGLLPSINDFVGFNLDNPKQDDFYRGVWKSDAKFESKLARRLDGEVLTLKYPFETQAVYVPAGVDGMLRKALRVKFLKHPAEDSLSNVLNPHSLVTPIQLEALRLVDGRLSFERIKQRLASNAQLDRRAITAECDVFFRHAALWGVFDAATPALGRV